MSGIYQKQTNSGSVAAPSAGSTLISVNESGELFTKDSSGNVIVYPTSSNGGGGGGSPFPFTGSADISGTLNVNYSDAFTFGVGNTVSQSYLEYLDDFGNWVEFQFTGNSIGSKLDFTNNEIYNAINVGNSSIPGVGSLPLAQAGLILNVNDGILSGSTLNNGFIVNDQTGLGGDVNIQNVMSNVISNTVSGSNVSYVVGTGIEQNNESSTFDFSKTNEAGERIRLNFNSDFAGLSLVSNITDEDAIIFRIVDFADGAANLLEINKGGPELQSSQYGFEINQPSSSFTASLFGVYDSDGNNLFNIETDGPNIRSFEYGFQIAQPSSSFTASLFSVRDVDNNILLETNAHTSGSFNSQVNIPHDGKSDVLFRILSSDYGTNYLQVDASGSITIESTSSGSGEEIFKVINGSRTPLVIGDIDSTLLTDVNLYLSDSLPTSSAGLAAGQVYTQTAAELGGSGATKVLCII